MTASQSTTALVERKDTLTQGKIRKNFKFDRLADDSELFAIKDEASAGAQKETSDPPSFLFVLPRYYRDIASGDEELVKLKF